MRFERKDLLRFGILFCFLFVWGVAQGREKSKAKKEKTPLAEIKSDINARKLQEDVNESRLRIAEFQARTKETISAAKSEARSDRDGIKILKDYERLVRVRYSDDEGEFAPAAEVSTDDITNINQIFEKHLGSVPLHGHTKVSARYLRQTIKDGIDRLEDLLSSHESPSSSNNPELQILSYLISDEEERMEQTLESAASIGAKLNLKAPLPPRSPANAE